MARKRKKQSSKLRHYFMLAGTIASIVIRIIVESFIHMMFPYGEFSDKPSISKKTWRIIIELLIAFLVGGLGVGLWYYYVY